MKLKDKVSIVTGGSQGIGKAISKVYAEEGSKVIIINYRNPELGKETAEEINHSTKTTNVKAFQCDVSNANSISQLMTCIFNEFGRVDILVNNAGIYISKPFEKYTIEEWDKTIEVNLKSGFLMSRAVISEMRKNKYGKIIFIASVAATHSFPNSVPYCASKGGMLMLSKSLASEYAKYGINVNTISPGNTETPINAHLRKDHDFVKMLKQLTPTGRAYMQTDEIAGAALFLASNEAKAIHGIDLIIDDGWSIS